MFYVFNYEIWSLSMVILIGEEYQTYVFTANITFIRTTI